MKKVAVVVFPRFALVDLAAISVFELASLETGAPQYKVELVSEQGGPVASSSSVQVETRKFGRQRAFDTVIVTGGTSLIAPTPGLVSFMRSAHKTSRRTASICTGAFILAEAGILDGRRATTHWAFGRELQRRFPSTHVEEDRIFTVDGSVWTSAGMTACIDLALAMVESDLGADVSRAVARKLVVYHRRAGGQSQFSALLDLEPKSDRIQDALSYAKSHLKQRLPVETLAQAAHLSPRQFSRAFRSETGQSPARAIENLRVEAARVLLETGRHPVETVAKETGFSDPERMRRAFLRAFGQPPQAIRRHSRLHSQ